MFNNIHNFRALFKQKHNRQRLTEILQQKNHEQELVQFLLITSPVSDSISTNEPIKTRPRRSSETRSVHIDTTIEPTKTSPQFQKSPPPDIDNRPYDERPAQSKAAKAAAEREGYFFQQENESKISPPGKTLAKQKSRPILGAISPSMDDDYSVYDDRGKWVWCLLIMINE